MAKAKTGAKKAKPAAAKTKSPSSNKLGLLKSATQKMAKATAKLVKAATKMAPASKAPVKEAPAAPPKGAKDVKALKGVKLAKPVEPPPPPAKPEKGKGKGGKATPIPAADRPKPRASKLPPQLEPLTKREMEQVLTVGQGRGVAGEGSLKGRLVVKDEFPYLMVIGRDKRELSFLLQGPDQEVLPAYVEHKVSVSGLIRKLSSYGGSVDVRKYSAKKPEVEAVVAPEPAEEKLRYLSPGEIEQLSNPGMGAGMKGFGALRGNLEMTGEEFFLVISNGGTRQQVSFILDGKGSKGLRKYLGQTLHVVGVLEKTSGWGGKIEVENVEPRSSDQRSMSRDNIEILHIEGGGEPVSVEVRINQGMTVRLPEKPGFTWAVEPTTAKRVGLREANFEPSNQGPGTREFFFTPRNPGLVDVEFFLAKAFTPAQVSKTFKITVNVRP